MTKEIIIDGKKYVPADSIPAGVPAKSVKGMKYSIVRGDRTGVFAGYVKEHEGQKAVVLNARRIWYWSGAASLSQLAMEGTKKPGECKFPCEVSEVTITDVLEIIPCTEAAKESIASVKIWAR